MPYAGNQNGCIATRTINQEAISEYTSLRVSGGGFVGKVAFYNYCGGRLGSTSGDCTVLKACLLVAVHTTLSVGGETADLVAASRRACGHTARCSV